jgi:beta-lactamase superfamily II metal-dependent hydrolase
MMVEIFDVEHGACALIMTARGQHVLIDCGYKAGDNLAGFAGYNALTAGLAPLSGLNPFNGLLSFMPPASAGWRPSEELRRRNIQVVDQLIISNYDDDHLADLPNIRGKIYIADIFGNPSIPMPLLKRMKGMPLGAGASSLIDLKENFQHTFRPHRIDGVYLYAFWVPYGVGGLVDTNNLSVVTFVSINDLHIIFPGDVEGPAWDILLANNDFLAHLRRVNVFVASHHGRVNGYHADVFNNGRCCPTIAIISDKAIMHGTQERAADRYGNHAIGMHLNGSRRKVLTTRNDGRIRFSFNMNGMACVDVG